MATARRSHTLPLETNTPQLNDVEGWVTMRRKFFSKPKRQYLRLNGSVISIHNHPGSPIEKDISVLNCSLSYSVRRGSLLITQQSSPNRYYIALEDRQSCSIWVHSIKTASKRSFHHMYHIQEKIGQGAFASVHRAIHIETGHIYAVKQIKKKQFDMQMSKELNREMYALRHLKHPSIVLSHDIFNTQSHVYIVMDYLQGGTLKENIQDFGGKISEQLAIPIVKQILQACDYLHTIGFVHRDVKLENILCNQKDLQNVHVKLADFGYVNFVESIRDSCLRSLVGTPVYVAPEIINRHEYGCAVDIYAIGIMIYRMLSGYYPYDGREDDERTMALAVQGRLKFPSSIWSNISTDCKNFIKALLQPRPEKRLTAKAALQHPWLRKQLLNDDNIRSDHIAIIEKCESQQHNLKQHEDYDDEKSDPNIISPLTGIGRDSIKMTNRHRLSKAIRGFLKRVSSDLIYRETNDELSSLSQFEDNEDGICIEKHEKKMEKSVMILKLRRIAHAAIFVGKLALISGVRHVSPRKWYHIQYNNLEEDDEVDEAEVSSFRQRLGTFSFSHRMGGGMRSFNNGLGFRRTASSGRAH